MTNLLYSFNFFLKSILLKIGYDKWKNKSWSQEGEDLILNRLFENQQKGFYIDVGAHHPKRYSNTFKFYKKGWNGINIDAMPSSMELFHQCRKRDINLEIGVGKEKEKLEYYIFNDAALNGFSKELSLERNNENNKYNIKSTVYIQVLPLSDILDKYLSKGQYIDFLSIDVEGFDLQVLKSNNWKVYRPKIIIVEIFVKNIEDLSKDETFIFLSNQQYEFVAKTVNSVLFRDKQKQKL